VIVVITCLYANMPNPLFKIFNFTQDIMIMNICTFVFSL